MFVCLFVAHLSNVNLAMSPTPGNVSLGLTIGQAASFQQEISGIARSSGASQRGSGGSCWLTSRLFDDQSFDQI